jgi:hypothetical protein
MNNNIIRRVWPVIEGENDKKGIIPAISEGHMSAPAIYINTDYSIFKQSPKEKGRVLTAKFHHKQELQKYYGSDWKNHLNIPSRSVGIISHISF